MYLSIYVSVCRSIAISTYLFIYLHIYISVSVNVSSIYLYIYESIYLLIYLCIYLFLCVSIDVSIYLSVYIDVSMYLYMYPSISYLTVNWVHTDTPPAGGFVLPFSLCLSVTSFSDYMKTGSHYLIISINFFTCSTLVHRWLVPVMAFTIK